MRFTGSGFCLELRGICLPCAAEDRTHLDLLCWGYLQ
jgi:hypothetical protein